MSEFFESPEEQLSDDQPAESQTPEGQPTPKVATGSTSRGQLSEIESDSVPDSVPESLSIGGLAVGILVLAWWLHWAWLGFPAAGVALVLSGRVLWPELRSTLNQWLTLRYQTLVLMALIAMLAIAGLVHFSGITQSVFPAGEPVNWDAFGALAEAFGALGQILVAFLALFVAWRQYVISRELTSQQNKITQQQTIDTYFQGISDLVLDDEGLLEDWPPERAIAEGRTAAILTGLDADGKAKIIRFLSSSKLLTPLKRDRRLGRPIFNGLGGYEEDIEYGIRVIDLGNMLANADLSSTDLRGTDLSEANLVNARLCHCNLTRANLVRALLMGSNFTQADLSRVQLFGGSFETASPRDRIHPPDYTLGSHTGAVVEDANFSQVQGLSEEQRYYCCAWGGSKTRSTIPGGCEGIPNLLGR
ncbi:low-complexity protein [Synechococcales cyanobacterium C]|uniref:Low-complexity protein n=1 Tax=Petrachloros mirabilis ULC683 TaxID=2781853 RepID=A0A8K2A6M5_9CYAN|nr:pentapeptide repeat-containing protein [Petrachloros mirabilis]NCJ05439.1 low-complexity protein [Petrachloros mirabilis ULC683]